MGSCACTCGVAIRFSPPALLGHDWRRRARSKSTFTHSSVTSMELAIGSGNHGAIRRVEPKLALAFGSTEAPRWR